MSCTDPESEYEALVHVAHRVSLRYRIEQEFAFQLIAEELEQLDGARLRAYVPQLVEHPLRERLLAGAAA